MAERRKILVTSALPYANGPIHFGHIVGGYLPADIFVRFHRLKGSDVVYICGTDEHGVAITIAARKAGVLPQVLVDKYHRIIKDTFDRMQIRFDNFSRTSRPLNHELSQQFFLNLLKAGHISLKTERQLYDPVERMFLADRYVLGTCPRCGHGEARGDECPKCGAWLDALELVHPRSAVSGAAPEVRESRNWYLKLQDFQPRLEAWIRGKTGWKANVLRFVEAMFQTGLRERCITRDLDWGVQVPLPDAAGKVLYVWFDAPIGYISSTIEWARARGQPDAWQDYWQNPDCRLVHFLGKDNIPFHCVVFPAMLMGQPDPYILPDNVPANEFYNLQGDKFNTSRGWYIDFEDFLAKYPVDALRYALAASAPETRDTEFTWQDFQKRVNGELADTFGNLAMRTLKFIASQLDGRVPAPGPFDEADRALLERARGMTTTVGELYDTYRVRQAMETIMGLAHAANRYLSEKRPWATRKDDPLRCATAIFVCTEVLRTLALLFHPVMPGTTERLWSMLGMARPLAQQRWDTFADRPLAPGHAIGEPEGLFLKIDDETIAAEVTALGARAAGGDRRTTVEPTGVEPLRDNVGFEDFQKLDIRIGRVRAAEEMPKTKKLMRFVVDLGVETREIVAGIKGHYDPAALVGRRVVVLANLAPRQMMGVESRGMILAAETADGVPLLLHPDGEPLPGTPVH
ncbi:MAG: methionine--tRNA ligase [Planctomycetes bacterium]|nr:methionine--tRNA ligase [Planctomycetota bacterium]